MTTQPPPAPRETSGHRELRRFALDNAIVGVAQAVSKVRGIVTLPLIIKSMGTLGYGTWAQITAFVGITATALSFSLHLPMVRRLSETRLGDHRVDQARAGPIYASVLMTTLAFTAIGVTGLVLLAAPISQLLLADASASEHIVAGLGWVVFRNVGLINGNVYRAVGRFALRSTLDVVATLVEIGGILWILQRGGSLLSVLWFLVGWNAALSSLTTLHVISITGWGKPERDIVKFCLRYSYPLLPSALSVWALDRADRLIVGHYHGLAEVGVYSAAYAIGSAVLNLQTPLQMTLIPKVAQLWQHDRDGARRYVSLSNRAFLTLSIPYVVGISLLGPEVLRLLANDEVARATPVLAPLVSLGVLFWGLSIMQHQVFHGAKATGAIGRISVATTVVNLGLNFALVPTWGAAGAALATVVAYALGFVALWRGAQRIMRVDFFPAYLLKCGVSAAIMGALLLAWSPSGALSLAASLFVAPVAYFGSLLLFGGISSSERQTLRALLRSGASA